jgi:hypothetical protein
MGTPTAGNIDLARNRFHDQDDFSPPTSMGDNVVGRHAGDRAIAFVA